MASHEVARMIFQQANKVHLRHQGLKSPQLYMTCSLQHQLMPSQSAAQWSSESVCNAFQQAAMLEENHPVPDLSHVLPNMPLGPAKLQIPEMHGLSALSSSPQL